MSGISTLQPTILSGQSHVTLLLARQAHTVTSHGGPSTMMAYLASQYDIPACKRLVNRVSAECSMYRKVHARTLKPPLADLPKERVSPAKPFSVVGIDYAGPFQHKARDKEGEVVMTPCYVCVGPSPMGRTTNLQQNYKE